MSQADKRIKFRIYGRKRIEVNTDPQRRCYDGHHFSSELVWTEWHHLGTVFSEEDAKKSVASWLKINPKNRYKYEKWVQTKTLSEVS